MITPRIPGWESRLTALFECWRNEPFRWGINDCVSFTCLGIKASTARDPIEEMRGRYAGEKGAQVFLARYGTGFIEQIKTLFADYPTISISRMQRGDFALMQHPRGVSVGLYNSGALWAPGETGLEAVPLTYGLKGWGVGHE